MGKIEYRELKSFDEFRECVTLQKKIFGVSDIDAISLPTIFMLAREYPPVGIVLGAIDKRQGKEKLVGFVFSTALLHENALLFPLVGVLQEYQSQNIGTGLLTKLREVSLSKKVKYLFCFYDPLEGNLGNYYCSKLGLLGIKYEASVFEFTTDNRSHKDIPIDKIAARWELDSQRTAEKLAGIYREKGKIEDVLAIYPVVNENNFEESESVLVEIPEDFIALKKKNFKDALKWRLNTRKIFKEYINNRGYWITEFYSEKKEGRRHNYYLLERK